MRLVVSVIAVVLYLGIGVVPYLVSGLVAPVEGLAFLMLAWAAGLVGVGLLVRRRSWWVVAGPPLALAFWALVITIGERVFGWTA